MTSVEGGGGMGEPPENDGDLCIRVKTLEPATHELRVPPEVSRFFARRACAEAWRVIIHTVKLTM